MHQKKCLAAAIIAAVENMRDNEEASDFDFRIVAQDNTFLTMADEYLDEGMMTCQCRLDRANGGRPATIYTPPEDVVNRYQWDEYRRSLS